MSKAPSRSRSIEIAMDIARRAERASGGRMAYADGGVADNRNMSRAISERAMRGLDPTPEQQKYLDEMQALRDQRGDENLAAIKSLGDLDIPMPDARKARQVSERAMRGYEPTPEQRSFLDESAAGKEARSMAPATLGTIGAELTGIPAMARGTSNIGRGVSEGDPYRIGGGSLETMLGMVPGAGSIGGRGLKAMANTLTGSMPRTAATVGATGFLNSFSDDAEAAQRNAAEFVQNHPSVKTLINRRREAQMAMQKAEEEIILNNPAIKALQAQRKVAEQELRALNAQYARSGPQTQAEGLKPAQDKIARIDADIGAVADRARQPFMDEIARINDALTGAETAAQEEFKGQATFRENYPGAPAALYGAGLGLAAGLPMIKGFAERGVDRFSRRPAIEAATRNADEAFKSGATDAETAIAQTLLRKKLDAWDRAHHPIEGMAKYAGAAGSGALTGAEASQLPEQIDYITHEPGHRAREIAVQQFANPDYWKERIGPAALGAAAGIAGTKIPKLAPTNTEFLTTAREIAGRGKEPTLFERAMSRLTTGRPAQGPTEAALADVRRFRDAAGPFDDASLRNSPATIGGMPSGTPPGTGALSQGPIAGSRSSLETLLGLEAASATPALPPRLVERMKAQDLALPPLERTSQRTSPPPKKSAKSKPRSAESVKRKREPDPLTRDPLDEPSGFWSGGPVRQALQIAYRSAGGRAAPLTGPVTHRADGGRTDTVPANLPAQAYVLPSDTVSSLGQGDTNAGYRVIEEMFGHHDTSGEHGEIPAIVAGGEYILSPEQVARIGNGNYELGFQALDSFVRMQRRKHIQTLKKLPPPVRD